jgi:hypothetical protein
MSYLENLCPMSLKLEKIKLQTCHGGSCFNSVIELNEKMLILKRFVTKNVCYVMMPTELFIKLIL